MEIKPGDIVEYRGKRVRVMTMIHDEPDVRLKLSYFGWCETISLDDVKLIESVPKPTIKDYDDIIIQPIPNVERDYYGIGWGRDMTELVALDTTHKITHVNYNDKYGWIGRIGGYTFQLYHIELAQSFDII